MAVLPDLQRAKALDARGEHSPLRYGPLLFHTRDAEREAAYRAYVTRFASLAARGKYGFAPVLVAMERLDRDVCEDIAASVAFPVPVIARRIDTTTWLARWLMPRAS